MPAIKRNLWLIVGGVLALVLLGFGGYYLWSNLAQNKEIDQKLEESKRDLDRLMGLNPHPSAKNVETAREQLARAQEFVGTARQFFPVLPTNALNNQTFKSLLETTIADLRNLAAQSGVNLRTNYNFSFEAQILPVTFDAASLVPWSQQLAEIKMVCTNLFAAKINRLEHVRRVRVSADDPAASNEYLARPFATNEVTRMAMWPYEFTFDCFSAELAAVLDRLVRLQYGAFLEGITVEPVAEDKTAGAASPAVPGAVSPAVRQPRPVPGMTNRAGLVTVLDEKLLRVTLTLRLIKPAS